MRAALVIVLFLATTTSAAAQSKFRCVDCKPSRKGVDFQLAYDCLGGKQEVRLLLYTGLPWHNQIRAAAGGNVLGGERNASAKELQLGSYTWEGTDLQKVPVTTAQLRQLGVKGGDTVYLAGYWPAWNHVWGYGHTGSGFDVPVKLPAPGVQAKQNSRLRPAPWPGSLHARARPLTRVDYGASQLSRQRSPAASSRW